MTLLQQMHAERHQQRERLRERMRARLRDALREVLPDCPVIVFGSLTEPGRFSEYSDIDIALDREAEAVNLCDLTARLNEKMGCAVDVVILGECRFRERILRTGELWTRQD